MGGINAMTTTRLRRAAREAGLLGLVAVVTYVTAENSVESDWTSVDAAVTDARWLLLPVLGAVLVTLLRLRFAATAVLAAAALFGWWPASGVAVALTAFEAAGRIGSVRRRVAVLALAAGTGFAVSLFVARMPWLMVTELHVISAVVCLVLPAWARTLLAQAERVLRGLRERAQHLEVAHSTARLQERSRIAQEMHDQLGHRLSLISLYAGALELDDTGPEATLIRTTAQTAMHELRETLGLLHAAEPEDAALRPAAESGLRTDIAQLVVESRSAGVEVTLTWHGDDLHEVATPVRRAVHRLVREGLTNVHRHARGAVAAVVVDHGTDAVRVEIVNGRGEPARPGGGLGLIGVRERVRLLGGEIAAAATRDGGYRLAADLPRRLPATAVPRQRRDSTVVLAAGLVGVAALVIVALTYLPWYSPAYQTMFEKPPPEKVFTPGTTEAEAAPEIGQDDPVARLAAKSVETAPPAGAHCLYSTEWNPDQHFTILRYCFRAGLLVTVDHFPVPGTFSAVGP
jgi:signal transduction histidine kinase